MLLALLFPLAAQEGKIFEQEPFDIITLNEANQNRVLQTLPDVDELTAGAIIEEREGLLLPETDREDTSFEDPGDFFRRVPDLNRAIEKHITTDSTLFRVTSRGTVGDVTRQVWCIAEHRGKTMRILRWREED